MFATLVGTNTNSTQFESMFGSLCEIAMANGFLPPDTSIRVQSDQISLENWTLELKGPADKKADFLLAVTAPKVPSMSPIPVKKNVDGPLFAVIVMDSFYVVSREDQRDVTEFRDSIGVEQSFLAFLQCVSGEIS